MPLYRGNYGLDKYFPHLAPERKGSSGSPMRNFNFSGGSTRNTYEGNTSIYKGTGNTFKGTRSTLQSSYAIGKATGYGSYTCGL